MPSYFSENNANRRGDTRWRILEKIVGELYALAPQSNTAPTRRDTRAVLLRKWAALREGAALCLCGQTPAPPPEADGRITEEGEPRITEEGDERVIE